MANMKAYFKVNDRRDEIKVSVGYDSGGYNVLSGQSSCRGYYVYIQPVVRNGYSESCTLFEGFKALLKEVSRKSKKAEAQAIELAKEKLRELAEDMAGRKGWVLTDDEPEVKEA